MGLFSFFSFLVVTSLGTLYPVYLSYKAIKNNDLQSLEVLLMFWIVIGVINAIESTFGWLLHWIPFFYHFKTVFMLWLTLPQIQGSTYVYVTYIHPFLLEHEVEIDTWLVEMKDKCRTAGTAYFYHFVHKVKDALLTAMLPPTDPRHPNARNGYPADRQLEQADGASAYALNLIRQFGPTASAFFHPMQNRIPDSFYLNNPNETQNLRVPATRTASSTSQQSIRSRTEADGGYQIPEYDEPLSLGSHKSRDTLNSSTTRPSPRSRPSLDSQSSRLPSSRSSNLANSGYDEIGKDEASESEKDWLLNRPSATSSSHSTNQRPRLSDQTSLLRSSKSNRQADDQKSKRSVSNNSTRWFNWNNTSNVSVLDSKKKN